MMQFTALYVAYGSSNSQTQWLRVTIACPLAASSCHCLKVQKETVVPATVAPICLHAELQRNAASCDAAVHMLCLT